MSEWQRAETWAQEQELAPEPDFLEDEAQLILGDERPKGCARGFWVFDGDERRFLFDQQGRAFLGLGEQQGWVQESEFLEHLTIHNIERYYRVMDTRDMGAIIFEDIELTRGPYAGNGFVINGSVYQGPHGSAGELSAFVHDNTNFSDTCACEAQNVSATGLVLHACQALGLEHTFTAEVASRKMPLDGKKVFELYHEGNETIKKVIEDFGFETGKLIYNLSVVLDLEKVAIGGGISAQECLLDSIRQGTEKAWNINPNSNLKPPLISMPQVEVCKFHNDANLIGAAHQYLERHHYL